MDSRPIIPLVVLATLAGACGSSAEQGTSTEPLVTQPPTTEPVSTEPATTAAATTTTVAEPTSTDLEPDTEVMFESEPIEAGPLFGGGAAQANDAENASQADSCDGCEPNPDDIAPAEDPNFQVDAQDLPFCALLADLEQRPFPSDDDEALVVARVWISELRDVAVESIVGDLEMIIAVLDTATDSQGQIGLDSIGEQLDDITDRIGDYVEPKCFGRQVYTTTTVDDPPPTGASQPGAEPEIVGGVEIPVIELSSAPRDGTRPFFGDSDTGVAGSQNPDADSFCRAVHVINSRPQPIDDLEEIAVGQGYFDAIAPLVPADLVDEFDLIEDWTTSVLDADDIDDIDEPENGDPLLVAVDEIDAYLETNCSPA